MQVKNDLHFAATDRMPVILIKGRRGRAALSCRWSGHRSGKENERVKYAAFLVSSLIGYVIGHFLLDGAAAAYASVLISYHLYLTLLVILTLQEKGFAMPIGMTIVMHSAFLAFLIGFAYARTHIPFFGLLSLLVPALAPFEAKWLFGEDGPQKAKANKEQIVVAPEATVDDHEAFRLHLKEPHRPFRKPGMTVDDEFKAWLLDRAKKRAEVASAEAATASSSGQL
jgi:hypothetical protein